MLSGTRDSAVSQASAETAKTMSPNHTHGDVAAAMASDPWLLAARADALVVLDVTMPGRDAAHIVSGAASGLVMLLIAFHAERRPLLRYLQALVGVWVMASGPLLEPGPIMISAWVTGMVILISAIASRAMFTE